MADKSRVSLPTVDDSPRPAPPLEPPAKFVDPGVALTDSERERIKEQAFAALRTCYDPELPVNIVNLGLIYRLDVQSNGVVEVDMTLTAPNCPAAGSLPLDVRAKLQAIPGVSAVQVHIVWDPPWSKERMSDEAKLELGLFG
jgi:FeS assembly SUF system protein